MEDLDKKEIELIKRRLVDDVRNSVESELKRRYSWLGIIALIFTSGVITLIVNSMLIDGRVSLQSAAKVQEMLSDRLKVAADNTEELNIKAKNAQKDINNKHIEISKKAKGLEDKINELVHLANDTRKIFSAITEKGFSVSEELNQKLEGLNNIVNELAQQQSKNNKKVAELIPKIKNFQESIKSTKQDITKAKDRANLSKYPIRVRNTEGTKNFIKDMNELGFPVIKASFKGSMDKIDKEKLKGIIISLELPVNLVKTVIRKAKEHLPSIEYILLGDTLGASGYTFVGASTEWASKHNKPLTEEEFKSLLNDDRNVDEFHAFIRSFKR